MTYTMIPYFEWRVIMAGPLTLQVWGMFAAVGVALASRFALHRAKSLNLDQARFESLILWMILWVFLGARMVHVLAYEPAFYLAHPLETLKVWHGGLSSFGGFLGAAISFFWQLRSSLSMKKGQGDFLPLFKTADVLTLATPLGLGCGRIGCFLIHDHPGTLAYGAGKWLSVNYPGGPRYDLGLLLGIFDFLFFGVCVWLMRKPRPDGFYFALFMSVYGPIRFLLDFLRVADVRYFGLTPAQYGSIALLVFGIFAMVKAVRFQPVIEEVRSA